MHSSFDRHISITVEAAAPSGMSTLADAAAAAGAGGATRVITSTLWWCVPA